MPTFVGQKYLPPPTVTEEEIDAYSHCPNARCEGNQQEATRAVKTTVSESFHSRGGDPAWSQAEVSREYLRPLDGESLDCEHCGRLRELSEQVRPHYQPLSGFAQDGLLRTPGYDPSIKNTKADEAQAAEMADMRRLMVEQQQQIAELTSAITAPPKRGPGRPPKTVD